MKSKKTKFKYVKSLKEAKKDGVIYTVDPFVKITLMDLIGFKGK